MIVYVLKKLKCWRARYFNFVHVVLKNLVFLRFIVFYGVIINNSSNE